MADEKTFIVPLRKGTQKAPMYRRAKKAINVLREYLVKHMKTEEIRIGTSINLKMWERGIKNPPHKLKVTVTTDDKGVATAELFGVETEKTLKAKKEKLSKEDSKKSEDKAEKKEAKPKKSEKDDE